MDDPALDGREHERALAGLRLLNRISRTAPTLWGPIRTLAATPGHGTVRILDIATGSGDVPLALDRIAHKEGVSLAIDACDISPRAIQTARARARSADLRFFTLDAIRDELPGDYDVVMCSLFTHHLAEQDVVDLLYKMRTAARRMVLVSDLVRSRTGLRMAWLATRLFSRSRVVRTDALLSVRAAFTIPEFEELAEGAGLTHARVELRWPSRLLLIWIRP
jgi:SAM-dependent methyltransferase